jgi:WD40 repeat protein
VPQDTDGDDVITRTEVSRDGSHVLSFSEQGDVRLWEMAGGAPSTLIRSTDAVSGCATMTSNAALVAWCDSTGAVRITRPGDIRAPRQIRSGNAASAVAFSRDGLRLAIGYRNGDVHLVDLGAASDAGPMFSGHHKPITHIDFATGDRRLLTASEDGTVRVRDLARRDANVVTIRPRGLVIEDARFVGDGEHVLTLGAGETEARLWNADGSGESVVLPGDQGWVKSAFTSEDGRWAVTTTARNTAQLYPIDLELALKPFRDMTSCLSLE